MLILHLTYITYPHQTRFEKNDLLLVFIVLDESMAILHVSDHSIAFPRRTSIFFLRAYTEHVRSTKQTA